MLVISPPKTSTTCPSCKKDRTLVHAVMQREYGKRNSGKKAAFTSKNAHCIVPQSYLKRHTGNIILEFFELVCKLNPDVVSTCRTKTQAVRLRLTRGLPDIITAIAGADCRKASTLYDVLLARVSESLKGLAAEDTSVLASSVKNYFISGTSSWPRVP